MQISVVIDDSVEAAALCARFSSGGFSDDTAPLSVREARFFCLRARGPLTKQSAPFALPPIIAAAMGSYSSLPGMPPGATERWQEADTRLAPGAWEDIAGLLATGRLRGRGGFFPLPEPQEPERFLGGLRAYLGRKIFCFETSALLRIRHCGAAHFILIAQERASLLSFFSTD